MIRALILACLIALVAGIAYAVTPPYPAATTPLNNGDVLLCWQGGVTKNCSISSIAGVPTQATANFPSSFGSTPTDLSQINVGGCANTIEIPSGVAQGFVSKICVPVTYTAQPWPNTAISGYVQNGNNTSSLNSAVALFGGCTTATNGANCYGSNVVTSNAPTLTAGHNTGFDWTLGIGYEANLNTWNKSGGGTPAGTYFGFSFVGGAETMPTGFTDAFDSGSPGTGLHLSEAFRSQAGSALVGLDLAELAYSGSSNSQHAQFHGNDGSTDRHADVYASSAGALELAGATGVNVVDLPTQQTLTINGCPSNKSASISVCQFADTQQTIYGARATDSTPTGNFMLFQNAAKNATEFVVDVNGNTTTAGFSAFSAHISNGGTPTLTGTCTTNTQTGGNAAGSFHATCTSQTVIITFAITAPNGWACDVNDVTTPADSLKEISYTQTSCTLSGTTAAADNVVFSATGF